jgi:hypothetical protein
MMCIPYEGDAADAPAPSSSQWNWKGLKTRNSISVATRAESISPYINRCDLSSLWLEMQEKWTLYATTIHYGDVVFVHRTSPSGQEASVASTFVAKHDLALQFNTLAQRWKKETLAQSSVASITMHPAYLDIIGMGREALPLILGDLQKETNHWFIALRAIAKVSPVKPEEAGNLKKMRDAWLKWGKENGFLG